MSHLEAVIAHPARNKVRLQYFQDIQQLTLNYRFGVHIGPSSDFSGIQAGMSEIRTKSDYPQAPLDVLNAATSDVPVLQAVLTLSAKPGRSGLNKNGSRRSRC